jgi:hypothetical protein
MTHKLSLVVCILSAGALLAAILPLPYGYYTFLRLFIALAAVYVAYAGYRMGVLWLVLLFACLAVLFNPIAPVYLSKSVWQPINAVAAMAFMGGMWSLKTAEIQQTGPSAVSSQTSNSGDTTPNSLLRSALTWRGQFRIQKLPSQL